MYSWRMEIRDLRERLVRERPEWSNLFPDSRNGIYRLRARIRKIQDALELRGHITRGPNHRMLFSEKAYNIIKQMLLLAEGHSIRESAEMILEAMSDGIPDDIRTLVASLIAETKRDCDLRAAELETRIQALERIHRTMPFHRLSE